MSRRGPIGGGNRRHRRGIWKGVSNMKRPVRWFSSIVTGTENICVITPHKLWCAASEGPTSFELIQGTSDFDVLDKQEVTITRVVGDISVRYSQFMNLELPAFAIPCVRMGILSLEGELDAGAFVPPDLFDAADVEETSFMWLWQTYMERTLTWSPEIPGVAIPGRIVQLSSSSETHVDINVNRKIGRAGHLLLIAQMKFDGDPGSMEPTNPLQPFCSFTQFLRVLVKT